jgi:hypothetical protein
MRQENDDVFAGLDVPPWESETNFRGKFDKAADAIKYMSAGNATVTFQSKKTETRFTYKLTFAKGEPGPRGVTIFVSLMTGPDNTSSFVYIGHIFSDQMVYWPGRKSKIAASAPGPTAFDWCWRQMIAGKLPDALEVWHESSCGRCGRKLTVPESVASGFGPECRGKVGL